jgi:hypothetical protein
VEYYGASRIESRERSGERVLHPLSGTVGISQHRAVADNLGKTGFKSAPNLAIRDG